MKILDLGTTSRILRRERAIPNGRAAALAHPSLAWRRKEPVEDEGAAILDLALCLILAMAVVGLLLLAL